MTRKEIAADYGAKQAAVKALTDKGLDNLTQDEAAALTKALDERDAVKATLDAFPKDDAVKARVAEGETYARSAVMPVPHARPSVATEPVKGRVEATESEMDKYLANGPFKGLGHFSWEVYRSASPSPGRATEGLLGEWNARVNEHDRAVKAMDVKATATGLSELADSEGAVAVPVEVAAGLYARSMTGTNLLNYLNPVPIAGNAMSLNAYADDSRVDGSRMGGVQGYWASEASQYTRSRPTFRKVDLKLHKLIMLVWATQELLDDSPMAMDAEISRLAADEFRFKVNDALTRGLGGGMPSGYLTSNCKVTQAAVSGQGANTITATNIDDMWARRADPAGANYIWIANQDAERQLAQLNYAVGTSGVAATWLYLPAGGITGAPTAQLKGRPVIFTEQAESLGTEGDLALVDFTQWAAIVKGAGVAGSVSMHLRFDYDETAFKFSFRMDAKCRWERPLTRFKGANTLSPIVTLNSSRT